MQNYLMKYCSSCALIFLPNLHLKRPLSVRIVQLRQLNDKNITTLVAYALNVNITPSKRKQLEKSIANGPNTWWIFTRQAATKAVQHNYADAGTSTLSLFLLDLIPSSACEDEHQEVLTWFPTQTTVLIMVPLQRSIRKAFRNS